MSEAETNSGARSDEPPLPLPVELPLVDEPGGTDVDLRTQIVRFVLTGLLSAVVDFSVTILLQYVLDVQLTAAKAVGFLLGTTTAYLINRRWTFNAPPSRRRFAAVVALYAATFAVQTALYTVFGNLWPETVLYSALGFLIAQGVATVINFVVQRAVIFKIH